MKPSFYPFVIAVLFISIHSEAQNALPDSGNVGIGTATPISRLHILDNSRNYYVNRGIPGQTEDAQGNNYVLLHQIYTTTALTDNFVMGKITGIRGAASSWNRKWTVEVNTATAYISNRGSMISYNEPARLVTLTYNGSGYLALEIISNSALNSFSFTGYASNEVLALVKDDDVTNVQAFQTIDPIGIQGRLGAGTTNPLAVFQAHSQTALNIAKFTHGNVPAASAFLDISNGTSIGESYFPLILGRSHTPDRSLGIGITGEAEDILPTIETQAAAIMLDGRSKAGTRLLNNNILAINSYGTNLLMVKADGSVGIGTINTHGHKLAVNGSGLFTNIKVKSSGNWPDYVFHRDYHLSTLTEVEKYIQTHGHLEGMPSAREVNERGVDLGEMDKKLLQKIEELTLHAIAQQKQLDALLESNRQMKEALVELRNSRRGP